MTGTADGFSRRRSLDAPVGIPRDFQGCPVDDPHLSALAVSPRLGEWLGRDALPIPSARDREGHCGDRHFDYWLSGLHDYSVVRAALPDLSWRGLRVLDFGGATGRVGRHFYAQEDDLGQLTICDGNVNHVQWVLENFPSDVGAFKNGVLPALPLPDASLDLIIGFSVFTHIDEYETAWLYELRRLLKPGAFLYATVHNDDTWRILPSTSIFSVLQRSEHFRHIYRGQSDLPARLVFDDAEPRPHSCNTFHPNTHLYRVWGRVLDVVSIAPTAHGYQSAVVLRNRDSRPSRRAASPTPDPAPRPRAAGHDDAATRAAGQVDQLFYTRLIEKTENFAHVTWLGHPIWQNPLDLWIMQETISQLRPSLLIECGTHRGGSSYFFASLFDLLGHGHVVTIDIEKLHELSHPRVTYLLGDSVAPAIREKVAALAAATPGPIMVLLDSNHSETHVRQEIDAYHDFVTPDSFLLVQDGIIDTLSIFAPGRPGPLGAIDAFLRSHPDFEVDTDRTTRFLITHSPHGWLRRRPRAG